MNDLASGNFPLTGRQLIEASAGTGKTHTITDLYIRLLLDTGRTESLGVDRILVLTFTIAATEELKHRIRERIVTARKVFSGTADEDDPFLQSLKDNSKDPAADLVKLTAASQLMDDAAIFTIHGFCARVLGEMPFDTGMLFNQDLGADRETLLQIAAEDCFRKHIFNLHIIPLQIAMKLWPGPIRLIEQTRQFLFRENLITHPPCQDLSGQYPELLNKIEKIQQLWIKDDLPGIIANIPFRKNSRVRSQVGAMTQLCQSTDPVNLTNEIWEVYSREKLKKAFLKTATDEHRSILDHEVFTLIDEIHTSGIADQIKGYLWHLVTGFLKQDINDLKERTSEFTVDDLLVQLNDALQNSHSLAQELARKWPVAMIDEFQDTDDLQYDIFSTIYRDAPDNCLLYIGDPKQAIYQFRGADIYTYLNARKDATRSESLSVNWRSTAPLVNAINYLFQDATIFGDNIHYGSNKPSPRSADMSVTINGKPTPPCQINFLGNRNNYNKPELSELCMAQAGEQIVQLLTLADNDAALIDGNRIHAGQIALLVRDKNDARAARTALSLRGINSVYVTLESVFLQDTAEDLRLILEAVIDPTNDHAIKAALATALLGSTARDIDNIHNDVTRHQELLSEFQEYHQLWATRDIAPMIEAMINRRHIADRWLHMPGGDRTLTNLRHLAELLQQRSSVAPGMHRLLKWFTREKIAAETVAVEDRQLRLESDEDLVRIVTMHAAKGLQYDIVMIPMAGFTAQQRSTEPALYHQDDGGRFSTHLDFLPDSAKRVMAQQEKYEEDMRLLYVAITRARYLCYLGVPNNKDLVKTAVGKLLGMSEPEDQNAEFLRDNFPAPLFEVYNVTEPDTGNEDGTTDVSDAGSDADHIAGNNIVSVTIATTKRKVASVNPEALLTPPDMPRLNDKWRVHSYTGVSRRLRKAVDYFSLPVAGFGDDDDPGLKESEQTQSLPKFDRFMFPRGPKTGVALHSLLEELDFDADSGEIRSRCRRYLARMGITSQEEQWLDVLGTWMSDVLHTPLQGVGCTFRLCDIPPSDRVSEMEFHFPLHSSYGFLNRLKTCGYLKPVKLDQPIDLAGMMTGIIDLVVRFEGHYYLMDYKSNYLGDGFGQYSQAALEFAVQDHHYDLQYLIYCVALHRFLKVRVPDYDYDAVFGGVMYLFLRGMQGTTGSTGIFQEKPPKTLILQLDQDLGGGANE